MDALIDEVESLEAILMDDVRITRAAGSGIPELVETTVFPLGDESEQYVCVTLQVMPPPGYPEVSPDFKLLRPRGLDDARLEAIKTAIVSKLQDSLGFPVVFDLIEVVREHLTGSNLPSGQCVVCLYGFSDGDEFTRTECFHYLHSYCLARHLNALRRNYQEEFDKLPAWQQKDAVAFRAACPVCRELICDESDSLKCAMPPAELENAPDFRLTRELRELQLRMSSLFLQQKSRGGIIEVGADTSAVIAIETEADIRRRAQRKHRQAEEAAERLAATAEQLEGEAGAATSAQKVSAAGGGGGAAVAAATSFAPVVQQTQRISTDPTNNNYQHQSHNRRHYRGGGGRRHQHHHHRDRGERERERHENHNQHNSTAAATNNAGGGGGGGAGGGSSGGGTASNAGGSSGGHKSAKSQMAGAAHAR